MYTKINSYNETNRKQSFGSLAKNVEKFLEQTDSNLIPSETLAYIRKHKLHIDIENDYSYGDHLILKFNEITVPLTPKQEGKKRFYCDIKSTLVEAFQNALAVFKDWDTVAEKRAKFAKGELEGYSFAQADIDSQEIFKRYRDLYSKKTYLVQNQCINKS